MEKQSQDEKTLDKAFFNALMEVGHWRNATSLRNITYEELGETSNFTIINDKPPYKIGIPHGATEEQIIDFLHYVVTQANLSNAGTDRDAVIGKQGLEEAGVRRYAESFEKQAGIEELTKRILEIISSAVEDFKEGKQLVKSV